MKARTMQQWLDAYGVSHRNATNKAIHWVCVPIIYFTMVGFLYSIPMPDAPPFSTPHVWAKLAIGLVGIFYLTISFPIMIGMMLWSAFCYGICVYLDVHAPWPLWAICGVLFVVAWVGQFYGHKVEGAKPSFFEDLQFLLIGPAWLMSFIYRKLGVPI